ncbi:Bacterio-opsin activator HTH domain-containing protein [Haloterrigena salina JCM 13891]|uniref:Bacterio-opsin activator HTH domain-containing protein n=1 Tax=Haloterrigena salina JCM 13891 TaxID=1227488 RepID=M0C5F8_9EURY|nr:helix-turn-helix domain-containing protein [Haloterrigena salina]ELZ18450.1 Bacterio-opsin activator HTH domain-containing protein [Haloterrigena salina JCM 13891]
MITASLRIRLPEDAWVAEVSRSFPSATFRLLSGVRTGDRAVELGEVVAENPREVSGAIATHPSIEAHERLAVTDDRSLSKYETTETALYEFVESASLPPEFPIVVRAGWYELDFTGTRDEFDGLRAMLEDATLRYELQSLVEADETATLLTDRQRATLEAALREGYFEVPRECTLDTVAGTLGVDESTASGVLRRGQAKLVKWHLTGADGDRLD